MADPKGGGGGRKPKAKMGQFAPLPQEGKNGFLKLQDSCKSGMFYFDFYPTRSPALDPLLLTKVTYGHVYQPSRC